MQMNQKIYNVYFHNGNITSGITKGWLFRAIKYANCKDMFNQHVLLFVKHRYW